MMNGKCEQLTPALSPRLPLRPEPAFVKLDEIADDERYRDVLLDGCALPALAVHHLDIQRAIIRNVDLHKSVISKLELTDVHLNHCSAANANCKGSVIFRAEFHNCRLTGINASASSIRHALFDGCALELSNFRFASFKDVFFRNCILIDSDFQEANLSGVVFRDCDLTKAQLTGANLQGMDVQGSRIDGLCGRPEDFKGLIVDESQFGVLSWQFARLFGIVVQSTAKESD